MGFLRSFLGFVLGVSSTSSPLGKSSDNGGFHSFLRKFLIVCRTPSGVADKEKWPEGGQISEAPEDGTSRCCKDNKDKSGRKSPKWHNPAHLKPLVYRHFIWVHIRKKHPAGLQMPRALHLLPAMNMLSRCAFFLRVPPLWPPAACVCRGLFQQWMPPPQLAQQGANSHTARKPVCKPHVGTQSTVNSTSVKRTNSSTNWQWILVQIVCINFLHPVLTFLPCSSLQETAASCKKLLEATWTVK